MSDLTHVDGRGSLCMVDVGAKPTTRRRAVAEAWLIADLQVMTAVEHGKTPKGNVYEAARIAAILAAKRTHELIPLCHSLPLDHVAVRFEPSTDRIRVECEASTRSATGVEMEALTAASVAALTLYDMLKALSKSMVVDGVRLLEKSGGRSGIYQLREDGR
ncbi:MAG: cyclic pyranopterin monophosphate synthase MoaC [bacterium]|nr:cyclic pyranopterin monophosphate synthase MoaC [bacterium]